MLSNHGPSDCLEWKSCPSFFQEDSRKFSHGRIRITVLVDMRSFDIIERVDVFLG